MRYSWTRHWVVTFVRDLPIITAVAANQGLRFGFRQVMCYPLLSIALEVWMEFSDKLQYHRYRAEYCTEYERISQIVRRVLQRRTCDIIDPHLKNSS